MRKTLMMLVAGLVLAGCSAKSVEVSQPDPGAGGASCASAAERVRLENVATIEDFKSRLNASRGRDVIVADFEAVEASAVARLDRVATDCGADDACLASLNAWISSQKAFYARLKAVLAGAGDLGGPSTAPPVSC